MEFQSLNEIKGSNPQAITFGEQKITIQDVWEIAHCSTPVKLCADAKYSDRIAKGPELIKHLIETNHVVYAVNTGHGSNCTEILGADEIAELSSHLVAHHYCGMGNHFNQEETRAILVARLTSLARGFSGVRINLLQQLITLIQRDILPCIPKTGSVGASGDLTPLSYIAAVLCGARNVYFEGRIQDAERVFKSIGIQPLQLAPKEGLALMNGTSVMTGLAALVHHRAQYLSHLCSRITSLAIVVLRGNLFHYDEKLFSMKQHPGQMRVAEWIRRDLLIPDAPSDYSKTARIQDRYSIRCAPHVIGVLEDSLPFFQTLIETELNSANDNPIVDPDSGRVFHGGMFYGGHICFAMDGMKVLIANLADLMDRQLALLVDPNYNNGLPQNLSGDPQLWSHGLKALQIGCSAWTAEALKGTLSASIFSRSTECHNQDKVSMGTIAARDCLKILDLTEQVAAALLIAVRQGLKIRKELEPNFCEDFPMSPEVLEFVDTLNKLIPFMKGGIPIEPILRKLTCEIKKRELHL